jgi:putative transposase
LRNHFELLFAETVREILQSVGEAHDIEIDTMELKEDHMHGFLCVLPRYSPDRVLQIMKSISAREVFVRFPWSRRKLWGGEFWGDGYFVRSIGDQVTFEIIRRYVQYRKNPRYIRLELWDMGS